MRGGGASLTAVAQVRLYEHLLLNEDPSAEPIINTASETVIRDALVDVSVLGAKAGACVGQCDVM